MSDHRVTETWMGQPVETLEDLLRPGLRAVCIRINAALSFPPTLVQALREVSALKWRALSGSAGDVTCPRLRPAISRRLHERRRCSDCGPSGSRRRRVAECESIRSPDRQFVRSDHNYDRWIRAALKLRAETLPIRNIIPRPPQMNSARDVNAEHGSGVVVKRLSLVVHHSPPFGTNVSPYERKSPWRTRVHDSNEWRCTSRIDN